MEESKKIIVIDENGDGSFSQDEIIGITQDIQHLTQEQTTKQKSEKIIERKKIKMNAQKERIMDKSFEL